MKTVARSPATHKRPNRRKPLEKPREEIRGLKRGNLRKILLMSHDPGVANYGYCILQVEVNPFSDRFLKSFKILEHGKLRNTYRGISAKTSLKTETESFIGELTEILNKHPVEVQIAERFMMRRAGGALTIELINQMIGGIRVLSNQNGIPLKIIPSSQWKNPLRRLGVDLVPWYKYVRPVSPHQFDAVLIAIFGAYTLFRRKPFSDDGLKKFLMQVSSQLVRTNRPPERSSGKRGAS